MPGDSSLEKSVTAAVCREIETRDLSTTEAAGLFGVSNQTILNWRNGSRIRTSHVARAAEVFEIPFEDLAGSSRSREIARQARRASVLKAISEGLDDRAISILARYQDETIRLVMATALDRFANGVAKAGE